MSPGRMRVRPPRQGGAAAPPAELAAVLVERPELREVAVGLLQVVSEDLLELHGRGHDPG